MADEVRPGRLRKSAARLASNYGMAGVLVLLCAYYSAVTVRQHAPTGAAAAEAVARTIPEGSNVLIVATPGAEQTAFANALERALPQRKATALAKVVGGPPDAREALEKIAAAGTRLDFIATTRESAAWPVFDNLGGRSPALRDARVVTPPSGRWPTFLKAENLINIANQVVVIALLAAGMTLVIVTGGIDLSVGSLVALSAVVTAMLIRAGGGVNAGTGTLMLAAGGAIVASAGVGLVSGTLVTVFKLPPFIATLGMMQVASGLAYLLARGQSIYDIPDAFAWLGRGADLLSIPNAVLLMAGVYLVAHVVMSRTVFGRYVYATGGNPEAARLSGVNIGGVLLAVYALSGAMAGLGGVVVASQLKAGAPTYGAMYELYAIAAVVVGGTSLTGGSGRILGTLIGALIIAVIQNGMNLTGVESYLQKVVLGVVILAAVMLDMLRRQDWAGRVRNLAGRRRGPVTQNA